MKGLGKVLSFAAEIAIKSGRYINKHVGKVKTISYKGEINNLVTNVDKRSEEMIIRAIKKEFPAHSVLAEESGGHNGQKEFIWVVDPLDGTINFAHTFPVFCVSIGLLQKGVPKIGVVYDPTRGELFTAIKGEGARLNGRRICVSKNKTVGDSLVATGFSYKVQDKKRNIKYFAKMLQSAQAMRRPGSAAIDLSYVACGRLDGFWELNLSPWDTAAGCLLVEEAGGVVTTINGGKYDIFKKEIVATNAAIHSEMIKILIEAGKK